MGTVKTAVFAIAFAAAYVVAFVYQHVTIDPRDVIFTHGTWSASGIIATKFSSKGHHTPIILSMFTPPTNMMINPPYGYITSYIYI